MSHLPLKERAWVTLSHSIHWWRCDPQSTHTRPQWAWVGGAILFSPCPHCKGAEKIKWQNHLSLFVWVATHPSIKGIKVDGTTPHPLWSSGWPSHPVSVYYWHLSLFFIIIILGFFSRVICQVEMTFSIINEVQMFKKLHFVHWYFFLCNIYKVYNINITYKHAV